MTSPMKLIIADDEPYICGMLEKLIDFETLGIVLIDSVNDGATLEERIETLCPDIVLTDISMPQKDGLEVIRRIREKGIDCRFIIISGYRQFEYAYNALKYDVDDYLLKPVEKRELNAVLQKICNAIRHVPGSDADATRIRLHTDLMERGIHDEMCSDATSVHEINRIYGTRFQNGAFRMVMMKLDFTGDLKRRTEDVSSVISKLCSIGRQALQSDCYEVVSVEQRDRVLFAVNYDDALDKNVKKCLMEVYARAKHIIDLFLGFNLTLCVGKRVSQIRCLEEAKHTCQWAAWPPLNSVSATRACQRTE